MPSTLVHYAFTSSNRAPAQELILSMLSPMDRIRAIFEQVVYANYLNHTVANKTALLDDYINSVAEMVRQLPRECPDSGALRELYRVAYDAIVNFPNGNYDTYHALLSTPTDGTWQPTIPPEAYLPYFNQLGCGYPVDEEGHKSFPDAMLLLPTLEIYHRPISNHVQKPEKGMRIVFRPVGFNMYTFKDISRSSVNTYMASNILFQLIGGMNLIDWNVDKLIGLLSQFVVEPGKFAMSDPSQYVRAVTDICYETLMKPSAHPGSKQGHKCKHQQQAAGLSVFLEMIKRLYIDNRIGNPEDTSVFAVFLSKCGNYNNELVGYFSKPIQEITATEAYAFKTSDFAQYMPDRIKLGLEAMAEDNETDNTIPAEDAEEEPGMDDSIDDVDGDDGLGVDPDQGGLDSDQEEGSTDTPPNRDPLLHLIELAKPDEKLSEYIYRRLVMERMVAVIKNPPAGIPTSELLLMKRWIAYWINLVSVASVKDFLSRLSFQLMDTSKIKGSALLE